MSLSGLTLLLACMVGGDEASDRTVILRADLVVDGRGNAFVNGAVLVRGDKVLAVGESVPQPGNAVEVRLQGVLAPGFVDAFSTWGAGDGVAENSRSITPRLIAGDSLDPGHADWAARLARGITVVHLVPPDRKPTGIPVVAGWGSAVLAPGPGGRIAQRRTRELFSLTAYRESSRVRGPTSLSGAAVELELLIPRGRDSLQAAGAIFYVDSAEGVRAAQNATEQGGFPVAWIAYGDLAAYGGLLAGERVGVRARDGGISLRTMETWKRIHAAGVKLAFGTGAETSDLDSLRMAAMAYARATGDADAALAAVTSAAADLAGLSNVGRIAPGSRADLVLWSGHPLDSSSRVKSVMLGGRTVFSAAPQEGSR